MSELSVLSEFDSGWIGEKDEETGEWINPKASQLCSGDCAAKLKFFFGERLRFNTLSKRPELDGKDLPEVFDYLHVILSQKGWKIYEKDATDALEFVAKMNPFDPIDYELERVKNDQNIFPIDINKFASLYLNDDDPLANAMWACFFIGAVARTKKKGCKLDDMLVLRSDAHGMKKSDLFRSLCFDENYFCDTPINMKGNAIKDAYQKIGTNWIYEIAELDSLTSKNDAGALKALLTSRTDTYRNPYGKHTRKHPRPSVFVGTANEQTFLKDQTGSRRFHVVEIKQKINVELIEKDRDSIWKAACLSFEAGQQWWLTDEQEAEAQERNAAYQTENIYLSRVQQWVNRTKPNNFEAMDFFDQETGVKDNPNQWDIAELGRALKSIGYEKKQVRRDKKRSWLWMEKVTSGSSQKEKVVTPQTPAGAGGSPGLSHVTSKKNKDGGTSSEGDTPTHRCETSKTVMTPVTHEQKPLTPEVLASQVRDLNNEDLRQLKENAYDFWGS
tara:strand:+ start:412 stop:1914 length:1503 start_codon:yes stop_codon:yes gene_type:complete